MLDAEYLFTSLVVVLMPGTGVVYTLSTGLFCVWQIIARGVLINILNPKRSIFFLAFLPLFVSPKASSPVFQMVVLGAVFMAMTLVIFVLYGISANAVRRYIVASPRVARILHKSFAATFVLLGAKLAITEQ